MYRNGIEVLHDSDLGIIVEKRSWLNVFEQLYKSTAKRFYYPNDQDEVLCFNINGIEIAVIAGQGSSMAACMAERLRVYGVKAIIRIGTCGSICDDIVPWTPCITNACFSAEGTSAHYLPTGFPIIPSFELSLDLAEKFDEANCTYRIAPSLTTDGRWMENPQQLKELSNLGVCTIEMETAGIFAVCLRRRIYAAAINIITDTPISEQSIDGNFIGIPDRSHYDANLQKALETVIPISVKALTHFYRNGMDKLR